MSTVSWQVVKSSSKTSKRRRTSSYNSFENTIKVSNRFYIRKSRTKTLNCNTVNQIDENITTTITEIQAPQYMCTVLQTSRIWGQNFPVDLIVKRRW